MKAGLRQIGSGILGWFFCFGGVAVAFASPASAPGDERVDSGVSRRQQKLSIEQEAPRVERRVRPSAQPQPTQMQIQQTMPQQRQHTQIMQEEIERRFVRDDRRRVQPMGQPDGTRDGVSQGNNVFNTIPGPARRIGKMTPEERRDLRRQINEAGQDIYFNAPAR